MKFFWRISMVIGLCCAAACLTQSDPSELQTDEQSLTGETESAGRCSGPVICDMVPPHCPDGTTPGIANRCWTGECIPLEQC